MVWRVTAALALSFVATVGEAAPAVPNQKFEPGFLGGRVDATGRVRASVATSQCTQGHRTPHWTQQPSPPPAQRVNAPHQLNGNRIVNHLDDGAPPASLIEHPLDRCHIAGDDARVRHAHARSRLPDEDIAEITAADLPAEHLEDYFGLRWARPNEDRVVIASTGFGDLDWHPLESESVTSISMNDLSMATLPLMTPSTP